MPTNGEGVSHVENLVRGSGSRGGRGRHHHLPCHLPITLPLVISLTAGTAFRAWLAAPRDALLVSVMATIVFSGGVMLAFKWMGEAQTADSQAPLLKAIYPSTACASCQETPVAATEHPLRPSNRADRP